MYTIEVEVILCNLGQQKSAPNFNSNDNGFLTMTLYLLYYMLSCTM